MVWFVLAQSTSARNSSTAPRTNSKKPRRQSKNASVLNYYGYMLGDLGQRLDEAADLVQRALKEEPYNGAYLDSMAGSITSRTSSPKPKPPAPGRRS